MFFQNSDKKWKKVLAAPIDKQSKFLNKICKINKRDSLVLTERYFDGIDYPLMAEIFKSVKTIISRGEFDPSFRDLIYDRLLRIINIEHLYPEEYEEGNECNGDDDNVIFGENYHVYTACYDDLDLLISFINSRNDIKSVCDLGSGTGRALLYMALMMDKKLDYLGLELVDERVQFTNSVSKHFKLDHVKFQTCDFLENPEAFAGYDVYYLYDSVGTENVPRLVSHFKELIDSGSKFYLLFISGWDEIMLNSLDNLPGLKKLESHTSRKQEGRVVNFYCT
ncbi:methyltransferase domain protein [Bacteriovorax sp. BAL6_X]|uniref:class I SAM-dependent methyltransferase n=1 Tax=Bacteriovorax sp. BAL6_X TaxID=1201290 RepID=UPI0003865035|nr:class I SAM-dependent methyltransferase [Bacteriovorax sp. BAL6_X]EPZ52284.1 methyltransferase domain protein [Bacteriovorax sp. BAL6_X]